MRRIAITGSSGYCGRSLVRYLRIIDPNIRILGLDITAPRGAGPHEFALVDVRSPKLREVLASFEPDTVVHLAFVVDPIHNETRMREINIDGSRNVCDAVSALRPQRFLTASSATAMGAWADNPVPIDDHCAARGRPEFAYSRHKTELEGMIAEFVTRHPQINVSWVRPCIVCGPGMNNYLRRILMCCPAVFLLDGCDVPMQFVHEDDVAAAMHWVLKRNGRGPFNMAPPDWLHLSDVAKERKKQVVKVPLWGLRLHAAVWWNLRLPVFRYPAAVYYYLRYPWVVAPNRLCGELGFQFAYSSLEALRDVLGTRKQPTEIRHGVRPQRKVA